MGLSVQSDVSVALAPVDRINSWDYLFVVSGSFMLMLFLFVESRLLPSWLHRFY